MSFIEWNGWTSQATEVVDHLWSQPVARYYDLLNKPRDPLRVPLLFHWLYFLPQCQQDVLGEDGHPPRGTELPPVKAPRRMWAGSQLVFHSPPSFEDRIRKRSQVVSVKEKLGKSGPLVFVGVNHEIYASGDLCVHEHQTIVYREDPPAEEKIQPVLPVAKKSQRVACLTKFVSLDSRALFRYSALTYNAHRIHYDFEYARNVEAYPGLVVHGPFQAMLLMDFVQESFPNRAVHRFQFSGVRPLIAPQTFSLNISITDSLVSAWTIDEEGSETMSAEVEFRP